MKIEKKLDVVLDLSEGDFEIVKPNFIKAKDVSIAASQDQTKDAFSFKWDQTPHGSEEFDKALDRQKKWYLELYGFSDEKELELYLKRCAVVLDAGAGKCGKAAWFAQLSPSTIVIAAEISSSLYDASEYYDNLDNLFFIQCDISDMPFFSENTFNYVSCDQVIHHTADPYKTFQELVRIAAPGGEISCYVYRKKALPRELLDDYFREYCKKFSHEELLTLSDKLVELGRILSSYEGEKDFPAIPLLGIEGGRMTVQRFIYWNFIKCYWNSELGYHHSLMNNYDWYSPSLAFRFSEREFKSWAEKEGLKQKHFHKENACYSGRFQKPLRT